MLALAAVATTLPIFAGYVMAFVLLNWLLYGWFTRSLVPVPETGSSWRGFTFATRCIAIGVLAYIAAHLISALLGAAFSPWHQPLPQVLKVWSHMGSKLGLLWFVMLWALVQARARGWEPRELAPWLLVWLILQFIYCVGQRYTGIDWTHGLSATLGPHRFAYGVYRVSGFMGHPLTLAYNLMIVALTAAALAAEPNGGRWDRWLWAGIALASIATLMISGSRFVLVVIFLTLLLYDWRRIGRYKYWIMGGICVLALVLVIEGSTLRRTLELFDESVPLLQRFPRLVFWQVHWHMFLDEPLFGVTMAGADEALLSYYTAAGYHDNMYTAHNMILQSLADTGLIGCAGFFALILGLIAGARRFAASGRSPRGISYLIIGTVLSGLVQNNLRDSEFIYALWFFLGLLLVTPPRACPQDGDERKPTKNLEPSAGRADPEADLSGQPASHGAFG